MPQNTISNGKFNFWGEAPDTHLLTPPVVHFLDRVAALHRCGLLLYRRSSMVCLSVCLSVTVVSPAKGLNQSRCRLG